MIDREAAMREALVEHYERMRDMLFSWSNSPEALRDAHKLFPSPEGMSDLELALRALGRADFFVDRQKLS